METIRENMKSVEPGWEQVWKLPTYDKRRAGLGLPSGSLAHSPGRLLDHTKREYASRPRAAYCYLLACVGNPYLRN